MSDDVSVGRPLKLVLFFTRGIRLQDWAKSGLLDREVAIYRRLIAKNVDVTFITYGTRSDLLFEASLKGIHIRCNYWNLSERAYRLLLPLLHWRVLARADVIKSNQIAGAEVASRAARIWRKPFVARCGYLLSDYLAWQDGSEAASTRQATTEENDVVKSARSIVVSSQAAASELHRRRLATPGRLEVVPNYVDTQLFRPLHLYADVDVLFVGRLAPQKNVIGLLEAVESVGCSLRIVGAGPLRREIELFRDRIGERLEILNPMAHNDLIDIYNRCRLFVLPSHWEGHPKTLIEAMACGCAVLVSDIPAMREVVQDDQTGWVSPPDAPSLSERLRRLLSDDDLRLRLGTAARSYVESHYSLDSIAQREYSILNTAAAKQVA